LNNIFLDYFFNDLMVFRLKKKKKTKLKHHFELKFHKIMFRIKIKKQYF